MSYKQDRKEKNLQELRQKENPLKMENEYLRHRVKELEEVLENSQLFTKSTDIKDNGIEKFIHYTPEARWKLTRSAVKYKDFVIVKVIDNKIVDITPDVDIQ